jgi:hypothetical protein
MSPIPTQTTYRTDTDQYGNTVHYNTTNDRIADQYANIGANTYNAMEGGYSRNRSSSSSNNGFATLFLWTVLLGITLLVEYIKLWIRKPRAALALTLVLIFPLNLLAIPIREFFPVWTRVFIIPGALDFHRERIKKVFKILSILLGVEVLFFGILWLLSQISNTSSQLYLFGRSGIEFFFSNPELVKKVAIFQIAFYLIAPITLLICALQVKLTNANPGKVTNLSGSGILNLFSLIFGGKPNAFWTVLQDIAMIGLMGFMGFNVYQYFHGLMASPDVIMQYSANPAAFLGGLQIGILAQIVMISAILMGMINTWVYASIGKQEAAKSQ